MKRRAIFVLLLVWGLLGIPQVIPPAAACPDCNPYIHFSTIDIPDSPVYTNQPLNFYAEAYFANDPSAATGNITGYTWSFYKDCYEPAIGEVTGQSASYTFTSPGSYCVVVKATANCSVWTSTGDCYWDEWEEWVCPGDWEWTTGEGHGGDLPWLEVLQSAPTADPTQDPPAGANGWNTTDVTVTWSWSGGEGGLDPTNCTTSSVSSGEGEITLEATCDDMAGNQGTASYTVHVDATAPQLNCPGPASFLLGSGTHTIGPIGVDASVSGLDEAASTLSGVVDASTIGTNNLTFTAWDLAGNSASKTCSYPVIFHWDGFFQPVDNLPAVNSVKAGSGIAVKFSLDGDQGLSILAAGYPKSTQIACATSAPVDAVEETVTAGQSGLTYDVASGQYIYVWKTSKSWAGTCRQLEVKLIDGRSFFASFSFK